MPPTIDLNMKMGFCRFARNAGDKMEWQGMAEIYLCLNEQYPKLSRQDPPRKEIEREIKNIMKKYKLNVFEMQNAVDEILGIREQTHA